MTTSTDQIKATVLRVLGRIAPEVDLAALETSIPLREQLDIDSVDFLNFVLGVHKELGVDIPEVDYPKLATLDDCVAYLTAHLTGT